MGNARAKCLSTHVLMGALFLGYRGPWSPTLSSVPEKDDTLISAPLKRNQPCYVNFQLSLPHFISVACLRPYLQIYQGLGFQTASLGRTEFSLQHFHPKEMHLLKVKGVLASRCPSLWGWLPGEGRNLYWGGHRNSQQYPCCQPCIYRSTCRTSFPLAWLPAMLESYWKFLTCKLLDAQNMQNWWSFSTRSLPGIY